MSDPDKVERMREGGRKFGSKNFGAANTPEMRALVRQKLIDRYVSWCPLEHRELNAELKAKGFSLAERKDAILQLVPGTVEHARREIANRDLAARLRHAREQAQAY